MFMRFRPIFDDWESRADINQYWLGLTHLIDYIWVNYRKPAHDKDILTRWNMIEIGSYMGESAQMFASSGLFRGEILCIDPWDLGDEPHWEEDKDWRFVENEFYHNMRFWPKGSKADWCNIKVIKSKSQDCHELVLDRYYDFIYIDGDHSYEAVKRDIELYLPKLKKGGLIAGHDYDEKAFGDTTVKAVDDVLGKPDKVFMDSSWIKEIK